MPDSSLEAICGRQNMERLQVEKRLAAIHRSVRIIRDIVIYTAR